MNKKIITFILALVSMTAGAQELTWQKCNESLQGDIHIIPVRCHDNNHQESLWPPRPPSFGGMRGGAPLGLLP